MRTARQPSPSDNTQINLSTYQEERFPQESGQAGGGSLLVMLPLQLVLQRLVHAACEQRKVLCQSWQTKISVGGYRGTW